MGIVDATSRFEFRRAAVVSVCALVGVEGGVGMVNAVLAAVEAAAASIAPSAGVVPAVGAAPRQEVCVHLVLNGYVPTTNAVSKALLIALAVRTQVAALGVRAVGVGVSVGRCAVGTVGTSASRWVSAFGPAAIAIALARLAAATVMGFVGGERGLVLLSDDGGHSWRQAASVPVSVALTQVHFVSDKLASLDVDLTVLRPGRLGQQTAQRDGQAQRAAGSCRHGCSAVHRYLVDMDVMGGVAGQDRQRLALTLGIGRAHP